MGDTHDIPEFVTFDTSIRYPIVFEKLDMLYYIILIIYYSSIHNIGLKTGFPIIARRACIALVQNFSRFLIP